MKRIFTLLLLFISVAGTFIPCCMDDDCADEGTEAECLSHTSHREKGPCSPFFACGTCAVSVEINTITIRLAEVKSPEVIHYASYICRLGTYSDSLFQPPRHILG